MEARSLLRPMANLLSKPSTTTSTALTTTRGHKTTARTKRALKIAPHPSFLPDRTRPFPAADSIIYNPPSSQATPHHTPFLFLPRNDPRRDALKRMRASGLLPSPAIEPSGQLAPELNYKRRSPKSHITAQDVAEMKRLRAEDPVTWSVNALAKKFECSTIFVKMAAPASEEHTQWLAEKLERRKARWGPMRSQAREDRKRREEMLHRGQL
ncbi:hypothetical protein NLU13_5618 [Sarocladium strictum]|uniref:60S ribosomal protein L20 n=1 Tax=Sarocladium strictum TaxID=5046 RepID=A0AA39L7Z0_SARSR|nr:hypothetical protein NLU13_5618 [Sarocladium strictum]